ncbi:MAG: hypothetical protein IT305_06490 [Chloroflexi bacterium]|nr:hypothetical protein [Chloroflexota bacterium]
MAQRRKRTRQRPNAVRESGDRRAESNGDQALSLLPDFSIQQPAPEQGELRWEAEELSIWPAVVVAGLTLALFGLVTVSRAFNVIGIVLAIVGVVGWVRDLRDGPEHA